MHLHVPPGRWEIETRASSEAHRQLGEPQGGHCLKQGGPWGRHSRFPLTHTCALCHTRVHRYTFTHGMLSGTAQYHPEQVVIAFAVWALGMMWGNQTAEEAEAPYECQPAALPWKERAVLTTDRLNITQNPKHTNDQPSEQTSYSPTSNHHCYLVSQMTSPTCCSVKPACTGHRWPLRRRGWHHVWCVDLSSVSSTVVPGRLQRSSWRTHMGQPITQKHFLWGWSGSPPLFLVGRALSWATRAMC